MWKEQKNTKRMSIFSALYYFHLNNNMSIFLGHTISFIWIISFLTFNFEIILDLKKICRNNAENSHIPFTPLPPMLIYTIPEFN